MWNLFPVRTRLPVFLPLFLLATVLFVVPGVPPIVVRQIFRWELTSYTWRLERRGPKAPTGKSVIVAIDDRSTRRLGRWPWPRSRHCQLLRRLEGAAVVAFDVIFTEPTIPEEDEALARCVASTGNVVLASEADPGGGLRPVLPVLARGSVGIGHTAPLVDADGMVRRIPLRADFGAGVPMPALALVTATVATPGVRLDRDKGGDLLVNFRGGPGTFPRVSFVDLLDGTVPLSTIRNKIVLVGSVRDIGDFVRAPFARGRTLRDQMPGVELHANAIDTIVAGDFLYRPPEALLRLSLLGACALATLALARWGATRAGAVTLLLLAAYEWLAVHLFVTRQIWLDMVLPIPPLLFLVGGTVLYESRRVRGFLTRLLPERLAEELVRGGERKAREVEATILFVDMRGYTGLAESIPPTEVLEMLNECYAFLEPEVLSEGGVVCDYQGDAQMIFFSSDRGTPTPVENHALAAVRAAAAIQEKMRGLNKEWIEAGRPAIELGCGIASGRVTWGWLGPGRRLQLGVVGDITNTAARLQALSRELGCSILLSGSTASFLPEGLPVRHLRDLILKGKQVETQVFGYVPPKV